MGKLRVYLDTSVISHLLQDDVPEKMADTRQLWEMFRTGKYEVYLSTVTLEELKGCSEPKREQLFDYLGLIDYRFKLMITLQILHSRLLKWAY